MKKLKGAFEFVKLKYLLFVFAAAVLAMLPTRVYQLLALVETDTGFFSSGDVTVVLIYTLAIIFPLLFMLLSFVSKEVPSPKLPAGKNILLGVSSLVMAAGLIADIISIESKIVPKAQISGKVFFSVLKANIAETGGWVIFLQFIFAVLAVIYFAVFAVSNLNGKASYKEFKLLALAPLGWTMTRLISGLMQEISFIKVSELLFEMFMLVFLMLFFITFARISSGVYTEESMWGIFGYGLSAALFAALITVPRIVMAVAGKESVNGYPFNPADFAVLVFVICYIFASLGIGFKDGIKTRKSVENVDLPDDDEIVRKSGGDEVIFENDDYGVPEDVAIAPSEMGSKIRALDIEADDLTENFGVPVKKADSDSEKQADDTVSYGAGISAAVESMEDAAEAETKAVGFDESAEVVIGDGVIELSQDLGASAEAEAAAFSDKAADILADENPALADINPNAAFTAAADIEAEAFDAAAGSAAEDNAFKFVFEPVKAAEAVNEEAAPEFSFGGSAEVPDEKADEASLDIEIDFSMFDADYQGGNSRETVYDDDDDDDDKASRGKKEHRFFGRKNKHSGQDDDEPEELIETVSLADMRKKKKDDGAE